MNCLTNIRTFTHLRMLGGEKKKSSLFPYFLWLKGGDEGSRNHFKLCPPVGWTPLANPFLLAALPGSPEHSPAQLTLERRRGGKG